ncbi:hypothetical protein SNOG_02214 [Parastagonospora nodorum SN15]|uniref:chitinase n=1 Tax=Phaeosphaeria nodorum (strain SN15 / ATCC MYA-4574 / FGSC 10173) TaxID=321614 RepID=Q0V1A0_PHANO|nr:hypothetical protein SNOG_02214 [Parastagonospora nodorum SN15]EAT90426.2 hypothetical protein SNOG_02214 [Parastagonospora nodorum SN15]
MPNQLNLSGITHLVLAFATIDPVTYKIGLRDTADDDVYREFLSLPDSVSKWIGIGGFQFTDSDQPTHQTFSKMSSSKENRKAFTDSLQQFLSTYKFSGVDIDWEWPGNSDRGGDSGDKANQVELLQDMRQALGNNIGLGVAIPAQYTYLQNIDLKGLEAQVDWLSILTYDLHGAWDATTPGLGPKIRPHTDLQEVDTALNLLWGTQIDSRKINMGIANYGRGYTVEKKECAYFGCTYTGPSKAGSCTLQEGILSSCEIRRLISEKHLSWKVIQGGAEVNEVTWDDQWIAWDDTNTLGKKLELANDRCLGGTALWAIDYDFSGAITTCFVTDSLLPTFSVSIFRYPPNFIAVSRISFFGLTSSLYAAPSFRCSPNFIAASGIGVFGLTSSFHAALLVSSLRFSASISASIISAFRVCPVQRATSFVGSSIVCSSQYAASIFRCTISSGLERPRLISSWH